MQIVLRSLCCVLHLDYDMLTFELSFYLSCLNSLSFLNSKTRVFQQFLIILRYYCLTLSLYFLFLQFHLYMQQTSHSVFPVFKPPRVDFFFHSELCMLSIYLLIHSLFQLFNFSLSLTLVILFIPSKSCFDSFSSYCCTLTFNFLFYFILSK